MAEQTVMTTDTSQQTTQSTQQTQQTQQATTTQQTAAPTDFRQFLDDKGNFVKPDWAGEEKDAASKFTSLQSLWKSYRTLERMNSNGNKVAIPGDNATDAEREAFYAKIRGVEKPEGYELAIPDQLKTAVQPDALKAFQEVAFKHGVPKSALAALADVYFKQTAQGITGAEQQAQAAFDATTQALEKDWGPKDGTKYKENVALAQKGALALGVPQEAFADPAIGNNPHFIRAMAKAAQITKEGSTANQRSEGSGLSGNVDQQISAIMNDKKHPYWVKDHPDHKNAVETVNQLWARKASGRT